MDPDLDDLRLVAALAQEKGVRAAARLLGTHVATIYRRLQALEQRLGLPLFERIDGDFHPTPAGAELIASVAQTCRPGWACSSGASRPIADGWSAAFRSRRPIRLWRSLPG